MAPLPRNKTIAKAFGLDDATRGSNRAIEIASSLRSSQ